MSLRIYLEASPIAGYVDEQLQYINGLAESYDHWGTNSVIWRLCTGSYGNINLVYDHDIPVADWWISFYIYSDEHQGVIWTEDSTQYQMFYFSRWGSFGLRWHRA